MRKKKITAVLFYFLNQSFMEGTKKHKHTERKERGGDEREREKKWSERGDGGGGMCTTSFF